MLNSRTLASRLTPCLRAQRLSIPSVRTFSTATRSEAAAAAPSTSTSTSTYTPPSTSPPTPQIPYTITLTKNGTLPIYTDISHQGHKIRTRVRRIEGDGEKLASELKELLGLKEKGQVQWNQYTKHVILKGKYREEVAEFLRKKFTGLLPERAGGRKSAAAAAGKGQVEKSA